MFEVKNIEGSSVTIVRSILDIIRDKVVKVENGLYEPNHYTAEEYFLFKTRCGTRYTFHFPYSLRGMEMKIHIGKDKTFHFNDCYKMEIDQSQWQTIRLELEYFIEDTNRKVVNLLESYVV
uniref:Uncharacterized protein n=1 Tax=Ochrobactrum phage ORM_20 TaxID=2985243 RepID=A0A9N6ZHM8_9VIRU|nr:hypothetical protein ORM20_00082 [Ochrobactrum phage ORM_20]